MSGGVRTTGIGSKGEKSPPSKLPNGKHNFNFDHYTVAAAAKEDGHDVYRVVMGDKSKVRLNSL